MTNNDTGEHGERSVKMQFLQPLNVFPQQKAFFVMAYPGQQPVASLKDIGSVSARSISVAIVRAFLKCLNTSNSRFHSFVSECIFQAISRLCEDKYKDLSKAAMRRSFSADNLVGIRRSNAILS